MKSKKVRSKDTNNITLFDKYDVEEANHQKPYHTNYM